MEPITLKGMAFTPLHQAVGAPPGPIDNDLLNAAIADGIAETDGLDWKSELPPEKGLSQTDFPKDIAAMANSGGGIIAYGVKEAQKQATGRTDTGPLTENHERALRSVAITAISPPVFGLGVHRLEEEGSQAVIIEVPSSVDGPHLIYRNDYFGAPIRNDADTVWMKERQIAVMYRARFDEQRHATEALDQLFEEASTGRDTGVRAWMIMVARPRLPHTGTRLSKLEAQAILDEAETLTCQYAGRSWQHPLESVERRSLRPGLRRWTAINTATGTSQWREAWASIHHDGSLTLATTAGGRRSHTETRKGWEIDPEVFECGIADLMALVRATAQVMGGQEYDVKVGIRWTGQEPLMIMSKDQHGIDLDSSILPLHNFIPVEATVNAAAPNADFQQNVYELAEDCINQGGISTVLLITPTDQ